MAVRDEGWGTVPGELSDLQVEQRDDGFRVTLQRPPRAGPDRRRVAGGDRRRGRRHDLVRDGRRRAHARSATARSASTSTTRCSRASGAATAPWARTAGRSRARSSAQIEPQRVVDGKLTGMFPPYSALDIDYLDGAVRRLRVRGRPVRAAGPPQLGRRQLQELRHAAGGAVAHGRASPASASCSGSSSRRPGSARRPRPAGAVEVELGARRRRAGCRRSASASRRRAARSRPPRRTWCGSRRRRTCACRRACTWTTGATTLRAGAADCAALGARAELAVSVEPGDDAALDELAALVARARPRRRARAGAGAPGRVPAGRPDHHRGLPRARARATGGRRGRRARSPAAATSSTPTSTAPRRRRTARRRLLRALPAGARRRRRVADGEPAGARRLRRDGAHPAAGPADRRLAGHARAAPRAVPRRRAGARRPARGRSTSGSSACSARAGRSGPWPGSPACGTESATLFETAGAAGRRAARGRLRVRRPAAGRAGRRVSRAARAGRPRRVARRRAASTCGRPTRSP